MEIERDENDIDTFINENLSGRRGFFYCIAGGIGAKNFLKPQKDPAK